VTANQLLDNMLTFIIGIWANPFKTMIRPLNKESKYSILLPAGVLTENTSLVYSDLAF